MYIRLVKRIRCHIFNIIKHNILKILLQLQLYISCKRIKYKIIQIFIFGWKSGLAFVFESHPNILLIFFIHELKVNNKMFAVELSYLTITEKYNKNTIIRRRKTFT